MRARLSRYLSPIAGALIALAVFAALACVHTWPLASNPTHLGRTDNGDALQGMWTIAWVAHQLPRDPAHLFDGNILYPERRTLAYSESMLVQGVLAIPVLAAGGSAVLAFNLVQLAGFALTGWAFCLLMHRWTGSWAAGYAAGSLAAFNANVFVRLPHLQAFHVEFFALMLFALDRLIVERRAGNAVMLGVAFALQALTSLYFFVFSVWWLALALVARLGELLRRNAVKAVLALALAAVVTAVLLSPYLLAYDRVHRETGYERTILHAQNGAAAWQDYVTTFSRLHYSRWSYRFAAASVMPAFPGVTAMVLVVLAVVSAETRRSPRVRMCAVAAIGCAALSLLPRTRLFALVYPLLPGVITIRVMARLEQVVLLMLAVLAGFGAAVLQRRLRPWRAWPAVAVAVCALVNLEALHAPLRFRVFNEVPRIYDLLAGARAAVVVELPFIPPDVYAANAGYVLNSTRHWRPILNGYAGFQPRSYVETFKSVDGFPGTAALTALHDRGVTHVVVHADHFRGAFGVERFESIARTPSLALVAQDGDIQIYRLR